MPKVPSNLDLKPFIGSTLRSVEPLEYIIYFKFERPPGWRHRFKSAEIEIGVQGEWRLQDSNGAVCVGSPDPPAAPVPNYPIGAKVTRTRVDAPVSFRLEFETGASLEVVDTSDKYESFSIPQENIWV